MAPTLNSFAVLRRSRAQRMRRLLFFLLAVVVVPRSASAITRRDFPEGFVFGAGSSAFQGIIFSGEFRDFLKKKSPKRGGYHHCHKISKRNLTI
ncbi:hypothetical protein C2845_PM04G22350 [Panicum miliaceum]|uniref:Uncharacterized protein n=1 Tax=Panicum miliaceum TaxID=4540 RepID=A0A3L6QLP4_PANMI|nr:hypothetical protein C2845_PM04G22350 [Panicum miliaceum]